MVDLRHLTGAYALDALDDDERTAFEAYLADHPELLGEIAELRAGAAHLAQGVATEPPPHLKASVLDAISGVDQLGRESAPRPQPRPWWRRRLVAAIAVASLVVVVAAVGLTRQTEADRIENVVAADDAGTLVFETAVISARFTYSYEQRLGVFDASVIPSIGEDETYELWLIDENGPAPAGLFIPDGDGLVSVLVSGNIEPGTVIGLTVEPAGGSDTPTGEILILRELAA